MPSQHTPHPTRPSDTLHARAWRTGRLVGLVGVLGACVNTGWAQAVQCHVTFAGASRSFMIEPAASLTGGVAPLLEGASLSMEVVNRLPPAPGAGVTVRTFGVSAGEPYLLHQAFYLPDAPATGPHGFTGLQIVREPLRQREIAYWCERPAG